MTVFNKYFSFMHSVNEQQICHVFSSGLNYVDGENWGCWDLRKKDPSLAATFADMQFDWLREHEQGYPNVANNADCVRKVLTYNFYGGFSNKLGVLAGGIMTMIAILI